MYISPGRKIIFAHIPKTGGTSLALALEARAMKDDLMLGDTPKAVKRRSKWKALPAAQGRLWKHSTLADIAGAVPQSLIEECFCFTLVRNPWDRIVSYYHWLRAQSFDHPQVRLAQTLDFGSFVMHPDVGEAMKAWPARRYLTDASGVERASLYIRLENFAEDAAPLFAHLGFSLVMPHENTSERKKDWRSYFSESQARKVAEICSEDVSRFGYSFEG